MVEYLELGNNEEASTETSIRKLEKRLGGKRYLLVLDDVWNTDPLCWHTMRSALERIGGSKESMVLTTTRSDSVAETMHASSIHRLLGLSEEDGWSLFEKIAFVNGMNGEDFTLKAIGKNIVKKCEGVPLALRSIAGILQNKRNVREWKNIEVSELWDIPQNETGVLPSLKLSYDHLSTPMLKKCFSLCAHFNKNDGWSFQKYELICRWMALGLIQNSSGGMVIMEDIGEDYFNELLSISFLLVNERNELEEATNYKLHDLVYDLARYVAMHERLYLEAGKKENKALVLQYLTVVGHEKINSNFPDKLQLQDTRSLDMYYHLPKGLLVHVKYLRVLCLENSNIEVVPESIVRLKCLKYVDLENNPIKDLPECITELYSLQSLMLYECKLLSTLPRGLSNLVNLRHLGLSFRLCPTKEGVIGKFSELQTLPPLELSEGGFQVSELGGLDNVKGSLDIKGLELIKNKSEAEESKLSKKKRVEEVRLCWDDDNNCINHEEVLDALHPNQCLKQLSIKGYGGEKFPSWLIKMNVFEEHNNGNDTGTLCNLMKIELIDCRRCTKLPTLGHLPCLKMLEVRNMEKLKQIGPEFYGEEELLLRGNTKQEPSSSVGSIMSFARLRKLQLISLDDLEEWCEPGSRSWTGFPSLEVLVIERCGKLRKAPNNFPMLKELIVKGMSNGYPVMNIMSNESILSCLKKLEIVEVEELTHIQEEVGLCTSLEVLKVVLCPKLVYIPNLSGFRASREIELFANDELKGAPKGMKSCKSLKRVWIDSCLKVETLLDLLGLSRLGNLSMRDMRKMISEPPEWLCNLPSLKELHIGDYWGLNEFPDFSCLLKIPSLEWLYLYGWDELKSLPQKLQLFTGLKALSIYDFDNVEELPDWLGNLSSLPELRLARCQKLKKLPSKEVMVRLRNLRFLIIEKCPLLEEALKSNGAEHHKIEEATFKVVYA